ncbi:alpha/beta-hydrolase [Phellopilus nigrolimitatus]|nr:alpha/beta-hydrolase [Phellopilus nigrolimitatus]
MLLLAAVTAGVALSVYAQNDTGPLPNSFPHDYPGKPNGDFSPEWQNYFAVENALLPNVSFALNRNYAGSIPVNRTNHPNDTLFFWAFEHQNGSLTAAEDDLSDVPWAIWLNGGPGASSMLGLLLENGPLLVTESGELTANNLSWANLVDYVWVDQPVGTGFSTADSDGYIADEDQMGADFLGFLANLVKVFPSLAHRPLLLTGESYAGTYIPYITKALFSAQNPPVKLSKIAMGNAAITSLDVSEEVPTLSLIETYPQLIGYDTEVYEYFKEQSHLCGFDFNLTYPQNGTFPSITLNETTGLPISGNASESAAARPQQRSRGTAHAVIKSMLRESGGSKLAKRSSTKVSTRALEAREVRRQEWKRDLSGRANGTIDPWYACELSDELMDYALNFSYPWSAAAPEAVDGVTNAYAPFNPYDLPDARNPEPNLDPTPFLNDNRTRTALHAPTSKNWTLTVDYPFNNTLNFPPDIANPFGDPSTPSAFLSELATNTTAANIPVIIYSGNDDSVVAHFASESQQHTNTTFGGIQGFTKKPQTPFTDDDGNFLGVVHQERGWSYILVDHAGHEVAEYNPQAALVMFREFILGANQTGLVQSDASVVGGEDPTLLPGDVLAGPTSILYGSDTVTSLYAFPSSTVAAWESFFSTVVAAETASPTSSA